MRPLTAEQAKVTGADKKNPKRYRKEYIDIALPLGEPPEHLTPGAITVWREIQNWYPAHILKSADRHNVAVACEEMALYRQSPAEFPSSRLSPMINLFGKLGGTPLDRLRLAPEKAKDEKKNDFDEF